MDRPARTAYDAGVIHPLRSVAPMVGAIPVIREHIVATPDTCDGKPRIAGTRIRVKEVAICYVHQGMTPEPMVSQWPHIDVASIFAALAYYSMKSKRRSRPTTNGIASRKRKARPRSI